MYSKATSIFPLQLRDESLLSSFGGSNYEQQALQIIRYQCEFPARFRGAIAVASAKEPGIFRLSSDPHHKASNEQRNRQFDRDCLSILVYLIETNEIEKKDIWDCVAKIIKDTPSRTDLRLKFLLDWDPVVLKGDLYGGVNWSLLEEFLDASILDDLNREYDKNDAKNPLFIRFQNIFRLGLLHYPESIGFLFHTELNDRCPPYYIACNLFGKEIVAAMVNEVLSKRISETTESPFHTDTSLIIAAATDASISLDGLYFLLSRTPTVLFD